MFSITKAMIRSLIFCIASALFALEPLQWTVGYSNSMDTVPEKFVPATVPGAAQLDVANSLGYPDYNYAENFKLFSWMEDVSFTYRTEFSKPALKKGQQLWFVSKGIDYKFEVRLNGKTLLSQEGMFTPVNINITDFLSRENVLDVVIDKVPKCHNDVEDRTQARFSVKPPVSYGWDWHPRLIPSGIWDETGLEIRNTSHISTSSVTYRLNDDLTDASICIHSEIAGAASGNALVWTLRDKDGKLVASAKGKAGETMTASLHNPELWWCHDQGAPYLYTYELSLQNAKGIVLDCRSGKVGFRRVRLIVNEGAWDEPEGYPMSRSNAPAQIELNGRKVFAKGTNWLEPEIFIGNITSQEYETLLSFAVDANFNMLRCWGGCSIGKDAFFDLCDEKGLMVWREFPLACNDYPDDDHYLEILRQEATSIVKRLRVHPCISMWCGGNELFNSWSGMDDQSLPLRLLNSICYELSPEIPFNMTSPLTGMGHGSYLFRFRGDNVYNWMGNSHKTAYTEFGMPGASDRDVLESIIPAEQLFPARPGTSWESHHAFNSWAEEDTWLDEPTLTEFFGQAADLDELIANSQMLQCEGYKYIYEEARRKKPYCSMALNWCFNEPWPTAANNSIITYPARPKPAFYAVQQSCRPLCASIRAEKYQFAQGEEFKCSLWVLNDSYQHSGESFVVYAELRTEEGECLPLLDSEGATFWKTEALSDDANLAGPQVSCIIPSTGSRKFEVTVSVQGHPEMDSHYIFSVLQR